MICVFQSKMKMQERMKMRSVSFSDEAPASQAPMLPPRGHRLGGTYRRQTSAESLPLYETDPIYGNTASVSSAAENSAVSSAVHHPVGRLNR